jgi:hypothetical protein
MTRVPSQVPTTDRWLSESATRASRAIGSSLEGAWWEGAEILLVAERKPGSTHKFFHDWRIEVVAGDGQATPGGTLLTVPISQQVMVDSGWQYRLVRQVPRAGFETLDTATFSWVALTTATTPDPIATATAEARAWLTAAAHAETPK